MIDYKYKVGNYVKFKSKFTNPHLRTRSEGRNSRELQALLCLITTNLITISTESRTRSSLKLCLRGSLRWLTFVQRQVETLK